jgi:uncharacterized repeat protein (TIGR03803 family)
MASKSFHGFTTQFLGFIMVIALFSPAWAASNGKVIYNFTGGNDGGDPATQLAFDNSGNAYGTTVTGGAFGCGTVFELTPSGSHWRLSTLYSFTCLEDGKNPYGGVTLDAADNLYGTTVAGGSGGTCAGDGCGTVYELSKSGNSWIQTTLYNFTGGNDGSGPGGVVVFDTSGNLYGTTPDGGLDGEGVVYELSPGHGGLWNQTVIHAFTGGADGGVGSLGSLLYNESNFYGVTESGGVYGAGTVFQLSPASGGGWTFTTIHQFQGLPHAGFPYGGLITDGQGRLFGTTYFGGADGMGTVFAFARVNGELKETVLHSFTGSNDGANPTSTPIFDKAGNLYVTTSGGGSPSCQCGTIFELSPLNGGVKGTTIHSFTGNRDGGFPNYGLTTDMQGTLYGTTPVGGTHNEGVIFSFTP